MHRIDVIFHSKSRTKPRYRAAICILERKMRQNCQVSKRHKIAERQGQGHNFFEFRGEEKERRLFPPVTQYATCAKLGNDDSIQETMI